MEKSPYTHNLPIRLWMQSRRVTQFNPQEGKDIVTALTCSAVPVPVPSVVSSCIQLSCYSLPFDGPFHALGHLPTEMRNYRRDSRKLKTQQLAQPLLLLNSRCVLKPLAGDVPVKDYTNVERGLMKCNFRYPHKVESHAASEHIMEEQPIVRRIIVDLRPVLKEAVDPVDLYEEDISDTENESISTPPHSHQEMSRTSYSHSTSLQLSEQDLQSENTSVSPSGLFNQGFNKRYASLEEEYPILRNTESIRFSLPSLRNCHSIEEKSKPAQNGLQRVNLVQLTNTGTLTFDKEQQFSVASSVTFPKIILKELPSQKMPKDSEQRPSGYENTFWLGLEKRQLPISELVRVIKEQTNSEQHTFITKVLCSLREKQEKDTVLQDVGVPRRKYKDSSQKIPQIPCRSGEIRLTWIKRG
ncbi:uncharacterized protein ACNLHF_026903 [Anomaloglossus baeobatrachus]|uniref:uncharacterized protein LOC142307535 n=1 Tax=Anomaloglossus baeobatrachus TaxID=238106 RepID=UPI003F506D5B